MLIHGLQGHPHKTWACKKTLNDHFSPVPSEPVSEGLRDERTRIHRIVSRFSWKPLEKRSKRTGQDLSPGRSAEDDVVIPTPVFWPADLLPKQCPNARILVYGYDSMVTKYMTGATNKNSIVSHGKDLLHALSRERELDRRLIFVAHSLGGIIVKEVSISHHSWCAA